MLGTRVIDNQINQLREKWVARSVQNLLNAFVFFLAFPCIDFLSNSVTFYIFLLIIAKVGAFWSKPYKGKALFIVFMGSIILSTILAPYDEMIRYPGFMTSFQIITQYGYWILIAAFFVVYRDRYSAVEVSKWLFFGVISSIIGFYLFVYKIEIGPLKITTLPTRNGFVFTLLCCIPIAFNYLSTRFTRNYMYLFFGFFILVMLLSNGRSGAVIIIIQVMLMSGILYPRWLKTIKIIIIPLVILFITLQSAFFQPLINIFANNVESISPRFAGLLKSEGEGDLEMDKSWLIRKLMIDKSQEIFSKYPTLGIGANNFIYYDADLYTLFRYQRLGGDTKDFYNSRSAHNSYIQILSEFGILGFVIFILILFRPIASLLRVFNDEDFNINNLALISLFGISMHFYAISSITGAIPWMVIGMSIALTKQSKNPLWN